MTRYLNPWTGIVLVELADGAWHHRDAVVGVACHSVMPGRAFRHFVGDRTVQARSWPAGRKVSVVAQGARAVVMGAVRDLVRSGTLEQRGEGREVYLRLTDLGRRRGVPADPRQERVDGAG